MGLLSKEAQAMRKKAPGIRVTYADGRTEMVAARRFKERKKKPRFSYAKYRKTKHWRELRKRVLERDGYACTECGATKPGATLQAHHLTYERFPGKELDSDLVTLCYPCHNARHRWEKIAQGL
jgi:5-methylcytosine-specific restriction endonuclease McrA